MSEFSVAFHQAFVIHGAISALLAHSSRSETRIRLSEVLRCLSRELPGMDPRELETAVLKAAADFKIEIARDGEPPPRPQLVPPRDLPSRRSSRGPAHQEARVPRLRVL